jgi:hypothetical protein
MRVTAPVIGRLVCRPRLWAYKQIKAGRFGQPTRGRGIRARALEVELADVEAALGLKFNPAQLLAAGCVIYPLIIEIQ